jgi:SAM-dependent methyltransferase
MENASKSSQSVSDQNAAFWDELCGTYFAKSLGVTDNSRESLKRFDDGYFAIYPYLSEHIPFHLMHGKDVLEVGLGYGTVSQKIAEGGAVYSGLDIAAGPVGMVNHRLQQASLPGSAQQGSILAAPFLDQSFDFVIAIGCLHHTGDLRKAILECHRVLRPGGQLIFMVYYAYSYRRFIQAFSDTLRYFRRERAGYRGVVGTNAEIERAAYDMNQSGDGAPHTDWISKKSLRALSAPFSAFSSKLENIDNDPPFRSFTRERLLKTGIPKIMGLDIYVTATK